MGSEKIVVEEKIVDLYTFKGREIEEIAKNLASK